MARTKASVGAKVSSGKSSKARCSAAPSAIISTNPGTDKSRSAGGGNPVCHRETPKWQRPITTFFIQPQKDDDDGAAGSSKSKPKRNIIESSDEESSPKKTSPKKSSPRNSPTKTDKQNTEENSPQKLTPEKSPPKKSPPKNSELDETIELEELTGENSHKIEEYYTKSNKGKGIGKKSKGKENLNNNNDVRVGKRDRDDNTIEENSNKKMKVN